MSIVIREFDNINIAIKEIAVGAALNIGVQSECSIQQ